MSFTPNFEQAECIAQIYQFIGDKKPFSRFLINGSAGTGKTSILISSIINHFIGKIADNPARYDNIVKNKKWEQLDELLEYFIISAPTNKAKDVLVSKYNTYIEDELQNVFDNFVSNIFVNHKNDNSIFNTFIKLITPKIIIQIINSKITFLTVSQILTFLFDKRSRLMPFL